MRRGRPEDVGAVVALERGVAGAPHWSPEEYAAIFRTDAAGAGVRRCLFVAEAEDDLLGFSVGSLVIGAGAGADGDPEARGRGWGEIESVAVAEGARRQGIGRALCRTILAWCEEQGAGSAGLEVRARSEGALSMYRGLGFRETGRRPRYYADPVEDAVVMIWTGEREGV